MQFQENFDLTPYNSFGIRTSARYYTNISSVTELSRLDLDKDLPQLILGGGSNMLLTKDIDALVIHIDLKGKRILKQDDDFVWVEGMAGENWHEFVLWAIDQNFGGLENMSLIPGNVGTTPVQNIGAYGVEIKDIFFELEFEVLAPILEAILVTEREIDYLIGF